MSLVPGTRVGPYEVVGSLGAGGMGEVYRARDERLSRDVAIKILPDAWAADAERVARFAREAKVLAVLNHGNIAAIYGLEEIAGTSTRALVMELVDGPTLDEVIGGKPMPPDEALAIARQMADGLAAAHDQGIVHRDLKPANVKITPDGIVKLLDFGLARAFPDGVDETGMPAMSSPTITSPAITRRGVVLGTAAYMSPEQAKGKVVDKRADVWAFGCVLFEMLSGRRPFDGDEVSETLAHVITREPDWSALPATTPAVVVRLLRRCLVKDPKKRLRDIVDARLELDETLAPDATPVQAGPPSARRSSVALILVALLGAVAGAAVLRWLTPPAESSQPTQRFTIQAPNSSAALAAIGMAVSPDGRRLVYVGTDNGRTMLHVRDLDALQARPLPGTEGAVNPFFSPDGAWIAYFVAESPAKLLKVPASGGPSVTLADARVLTGVWLADDTIIFGLYQAGAEAGGELARVSSAGGAVTLVSRPARDTGETWHAYPERLPDPDHVLISIRIGADFSNSRIAVLSLKTGETRTLIDQGYYGRYVPTGHIVYVGDGTLLAVPFDVTRLQVTGPPVPIVERIATNPTRGATQFAVSPTGFLVYQADVEVFPGRELVWVTREGAEEPIAAPAREYLYPRISPDGTRVAVSARDGEQDIWVWDFTRPSLARLTAGPAVNTYPVWSPDGKRIVFSESGTLRWQAADGSGPAETLLVPQPRGIFAFSFSPDGRQLTFRQVGEKTNEDLAVLDLRDRTVMTLIAEPLFEHNAEISPDGRWVAYQSSEGGDFEVVIRPFPAVNTGRWQISTDGGTRPVWSRNSRELFYLATDGPAVRVMSVSVGTGSAPSFGSPVRLFSGPYAVGALPNAYPGRTYDVSPDGRFLMIRARDDASTGTGAPFTIVLNWFDELKRLAPTRP